MTLRIASAFSKAGMDGADRIRVHPVCQELTPTKPHAALSAAPPPNVAAMLKFSAMRRDLAETFRERWKMSGDAPERTPFVGVSGDGPNRYVAQVESDDWRNSAPPSDIQAEDPTAPDIVAVSFCRPYASDVAVI